MEQADRTNYEQEDPKHPTEAEALDRATERIDEALHNVAEAEKRMAQNTGDDT